MTTLSITERNDLQYLEQQIQSGLKTFIEVGEALWKIREGKLYRESHGTFEAYCKERWGMSKTHANRLITANEIAEQMAPTGVKINSERQARELSRVPTEKRAEVIERVQQSGEKVTAKTIKVAATDVLDDGLPDKPPATVGGAMPNAEAAIRSLQKIPHDDIDRERALRKVLTYLNKELK